MHEMEDALKPVSETRALLDRQRQILDLYRAKQSEVQALPGGESERLTLADFTA